MRLYDEMTDVPGVRAFAVEQAAVQHDAATDTRAHHHGDVVVEAPRRPPPPLTEGQRLGVVVHPHVEAGELS